MPRLHGERTANPDALLLTAGQLRRIVVGVVGQRHLVEQSSSLIFGLARLVSTLDRSQHDVLQRFQVRIEVELLEDHRARPADPGQHCPIPDGVPVHLDVAGPDGSSPLMQRIRVLLPTRTDR